VDFFQNHAITCQLIVGEVTFFKSCNFWRSRRKRVFHCPQGVLVDSHTSPLQQQDLALTKVKSVHASAPLCCSLLAQRSKKLQHQAREKNKTRTALRRLQVRVHTSHPRPGGRVSIMSKWLNKKRQVRSHPSSFRSNISLAARCARAGGQTPSPSRCVSCCWKWLMCVVVGASTFL
jgi:hypothetical protein